MNRPPHPLAGASVSSPPRGTTPQDCPGIDDGVSAGYIRLPLLALRHASCVIVGLSLSSVSALAQPTDRAGGATPSDEQAAAETTPPPSSTDSNSADSNSADSNSADSNSADSNSAEPSAVPSATAKKPVVSDEPADAPNRLGGSTAVEETPSPRSVSASGAPTAPNDAEPVDAALAELLNARSELEAWTERSERAEAQAYCDHVRAAQQSDAALLRSPWLAAHGSTLQRGELNGPSVPISPRVRFGLGFSVSDWLRADLLARRAEHDCGVHQAELALSDGHYDVDAVTLDGWKNKAQLLQQALGEADQLLARSEHELQLGDRTVTTHLATLAAHQRLHEALADARTRVARLSVAPPAPAPATGRVDALRRSVLELERVEGQLRRNRALSVSVEGGYDEIIGVDQTVPAYGQVSVTFRPGYFWQSSADESSARARAAAAAQRAARVQASVRRALLTLEAQKAPMQIEASRIQSLIALLERQRAVLNRVPNPQAIEMAQRLWFELQLRRAELAQLQGSLQAMARWAEQLGPSPAK